MPGSQSARRRFQRIPFEAMVTVRHGDEEWQGPLLDLSLNGLLMGRPDGWHEESKQERHYEIEIALADGGLKLRMQDTTIAHMEESRIGLSCRRIDIDSIALLKRIIEFNLGDADLVHRELASLGAAGPRENDPTHSRQTRRKR